VGSRSIIGKSFWNPNPGRPVLKTLGALGEKTLRGGKHIWGRKICGAKKKKKGGGGGGQTPNTEETK